MNRLYLTKHHALGNDFLVLLDLEGRRPVDAGLARSLCDRHRGVGADGVVRASAGTDGADVTMEIRNADGSPAQTSGNGLRCLAQAVLDARVVRGPHLTVATAAGVRHLSATPANGQGAVEVRVDMGPAALGPEATVELAGRARSVDIGNPHLVLLGPDPREVDLAALASRFDGVNVEVVRSGPGDDELDMRVWERGVGETLACGSGACAAVAAAHDWGVVGSRVVVRQPGGAVHVDLEADCVVLTGPAQYVARVEVDLERR